MGDRIQPVKVILDESRKYELEPLEIEDLRPKPRRDILLICGDGWNLLDDLEKFYDFGVDHDAMALNYAPLVVPKFQHYAAGDSHQDEMQRMAYKLPKGVVKHCWNPGSKGFDVRWIKNDNRGWTGTTGNLAVKIGLALDYVRIVLAGCPMDGGGNWYKHLVKKDDVKANKEGAHLNHLYFWTQLAARPPAKFIRSMSGNTKDLFGYPTIEWLLRQPEKRGGEDERQVSG